ncbi:hypothetical protein NDA11_007067 [Ustilago hordei]|uniref:Uncharacterized protein n=1 Tax=Ustilago hordei TaxID=120017 RepID=I2FVE7_USTHO|nr:uncharacterized protein UHO2_04423 [Ustilago hordei]KAJ1042362.1 hypothetical protein NDA10_003790 [Ustilago hordei]KAJ1578025.1 hypothetical protein NDA12_002090 [Ustilago hordei]KAJ1578448.1 hypothetical protein NDA11_007067 [Ustilago hordei]KAJ1592466.1 hypothetical protein NDA15_003025 [Ustilago hordei]KAJ1595798.1 hypothetical protein NDA14_003687 [Ustilago hordei]
MAGESLNLALKRIRKVDKVRDLSSDYELQDEPAPKSEGQTGTTGLTEANRRVEWASRCWSKATNESDDAVAAAVVVCDHARGAREVREQNILLKETIQYDDAG